MAYDKVIDSAVLDADLTAVADAIRAKGGTSEALSFPDGFVSAVGAIQAGGGGGNDATAIARSILDKTIARYVDDEPINIMGGVFKDCKMLEYVNMPNTDGSWSGIQTDIFSGCVSLETAIVPSFRDAGNNMFYNCKALKTVDASAMRSLGSGSFSGCTSLEELNFPSLNSNVFANAVLNCTSLRKVDFGGSPPLSRTAFSGCTSLEIFIIRGTKGVASLSNVNSFTNTPIENGTGYIYVPRTLANGSDGVATYQASTNWSTFANQFRAIEDYPEICGEVSA